MGIIIRYGGKAKDPSATDSALSFVLAKNASDQIVHSYDPEQSLSNTVKALIVSH